MNNLGKNASRLALSSLLSLALIGCGSGALGQASQEFDTHYRTKVAAENTGATPATSAELQQSLAMLSSLADKTVTQASNEANPVTKIGLYRVAALAAWQAGSPRVVAISETGQNACQQNGMQPPGDCSLLQVVPEFARVSETRKRMAAADAKAPNSRAFKRLPVPKQVELRDEANRIMGRYQQSINALLSERPKLQQSQASDSFKAMLDANIASVVCEHFSSSETFFKRTHRAQKTARKKARCNVLVAKETMLAAGVSTDGSRCLDTDLEAVRAAREADCQ